VVPARAAQDHRVVLHRDQYQDSHYKNQQHHHDSPVLDHGNMTSTSASTSSASHNLPGTPDREKQLRNTEQASPHVRTNFRRGYRPPATKDNPVRQPPPIERQEPRTSNTSDRSDEMPFDVKKDMAISPREGQQPRHSHTNWAAREELDPERGRFLITPPKFSNPTPLDTVHHPTAAYGVGRNKAVAALGMSAGSTAGRVEDYYSSPNRVFTPNPDPSDYEEFGLSPGCNSAGTASKGEMSAPEEEDSLFDFELEAKSPGLPKIGSNRKSSYVRHRRRRDQQEKHVVVEEQDDRDDDTASLEEEEEAPYGHKTPSPTNLHERAAQAWSARRREKVSSLRSSNKSKENAWPKIQTKSKEEPTTTTTTSPPKEESLNVSFGVIDTVHHFQPHTVEDDDDDGTLGTYNSVDDRSLNSEYTKTIESEVEDVIKDIFLIGTESKSKPGRRKLKYRHEVKVKLRQRKTKVYEGEASSGDKNDTENDNVAGISNISPSSPDRSRNSKKYPPSSPDRSSQQKAASNVEPRNSVEETPPPNSPNRGTPPNSPKSVKSTKTEKQTSKAHQEQKEEEGDPFLAMWGYVEGGMKAMSEALGLETDPTETTEMKASSSSSKKPTLSSSSQKKGVKSSNTLKKSSDKTLILSGDEACTDSPTKTTRKAAPIGEADQGLGGFMDFAQDTMFGPVLSGDSGVSIRGDTLSLVEKQQNFSFPSPIFVIQSFDLGGSKSQSRSVSIDEEDDIDDDIDDDIVDDIDDAEHDSKPLPASHLEERDPRLVHLALNAARSKHQIRGVEFDESIPINLHSEVKVSVLELTLPLGRKCLVCFMLTDNTVGHF
jgi:hypothetical protein